MSLASCRVPLVTGRGFFMPHQGNNPLYSSAFGDVAVLAAVPLTGIVPTPPSGAAG
jgi:hypothetical protein